MDLDHLSHEQVLELNIPTGIPLVYTFDDDGRIEHKKYLFERDDAQKV
jgi:2,3-bisphosphoglycerate-dependent phosphoglycerate mutase